MSPVTLATAWSKQHDFVASTIVGVSKEDQLDDIFSAIDLKLSAEVMTAVHKVTKEILYPMGLRGGGRNPLLALIHNLCLRITQRFAQSL